MLILSDHIDFSQEVSISNLVLPIVCLFFHSLLLVVLFFFFHSPIPPLETSFTELDFCIICEKYDNLNLAIFTWRENSELISSRIHLFFDYLLHSQASFPTPKVQKFQYSFSPVSSKYNIGLLFGIIACMSLLLIDTS